MQLVDQLGHPVHLGKAIVGAKGGEAQIFSVIGQSGLVAKIYTVPPSPQKLAKLKAMLNRPPIDPSAKQGHVSICWPTALLYESHNRFVGFLMARVDSTTSVAIFKVYNPQDRRRVAPRFTWEYLVRTAVNVATVVEAIHADNCVIGDLNESNFLVSDRALVSLVDCDSMQVPMESKQGFFRCVVRKPEFTAPELIGVDLNQVYRSTHTDNFALGILTFLLLMEGYHPYQGLWQGAGDTPDQEALIQRGQCPYVGVSQLKVPPLALPIEVLPAPIRALITRCFNEGHKDPKARPTPREWHQSLQALERNLKSCSSNKQHIFSNHLSSCPWCERTRILNGFDPFLDHSQVYVQKTILAAASTGVSARPQPNAPPVMQNPAMPSGSSQDWVYELITACVFVLIIIFGKFLVSTSDKVTFLQQPATNANVEDSAAATVRSFYIDLGKNDVEAASDLLIPEKRNGPFSVARMKRFYGSLDEPIQLLSLQIQQDGNYLVRYRYRTGRNSCEGSAIVTTTHREGIDLIAKIQALGGC